MLETTINILGYKVSTIKPEQIGINIKSSVEFNGTLNKKAQKWLACLNPHSYAVANKDADFAVSLKSADWLIPDGIGIVIASCLFGRPLTSRVTGFDIFNGVMEELEKSSGSVFFLGGTEATLQMIRTSVLKDYPNIRIAGTLSPPFKPNYTDTECMHMVEKVNASKTDVLWVAMTAPKQEKWIHRNISNLDVEFCGAIGAVFNFYTNEVKRSPKIFQRLGLEWLPRLIQQPRRLWRRMGISAPIFVSHVIIAFIREKILRLN